MLLVALAMLRLPMLILRKVLASQSTLQVERETAGVDEEMEEKLHCCILMLLIICTLKLTPDTNINSSKDNSGARKALRNSN